MRKVLGFFGKCLDIKNKDRVDALRNNRYLQVMILAVCFTLVSLYIVFFGVQLGEITSVLERNDTEYRNSKNMLYEIKSYKQTKNNTLKVKLKDGDTVEFMSSEDYKLVVTRKLKQDECVLDKENNTIIQGVSDDYGRNILTGSNIYLMWIFMLFILGLLIFGKTRKLSVLGGKLAFGLYIVNFMLLALLTVYTLTNF